MDSPVVIIGAGPAGLRACQTLVEHGIRPVLIDEGAAFGGQIYRQPPRQRTRPARELYGFEASKAEALHKSAAAMLSRIDYRPETLVWDARPGVLDTIGPKGGASLSYSRVILATGATDRLLPFEGWTRPGVFSLGAAQIALKYQHCLIGRRVVLAGTGPLLYLVAYQYAKAGAKLVAVLDSAPFSAQWKAAAALMRKPAILGKGIYYRTWLRLHGIQVLNDVVPVSIVGERRVEGLRCKQGGQYREYVCDAVATGYGLRSETQLADLFECDFVYSALNRAWLPKLGPGGRSSLRGVYLAGDGAGIGGADMAELAGERAALALLEDLGHKFAASHARRLDRRVERWRAFRRSLEQAFPFPSRPAWPRHADTILCRCEEVTYGQAQRAIQEFDISEINRLKAVCRVGMGRCQGRMCGPAAIELLAEERDCSPADVGRLRAQSPVKPLSINAFFPE